MWLCGVSWTRNTTWWHMGPATGQVPFRRWAAWLYQAAWHQVHPKPANNRPWVDLRQRSLGFLRWGQKTEARLLSGLCPSMSICPISSFNQYFSNLCQGTCVAVNKWKNGGSGGQETERWVGRVLQAQKDFGKWSVNQSELGFLLYANEYLYFSKYFPVLEATKPFLRGTPNDPEVSRVPWTLSGEDPDIPRGN